MSAVEIIAAYLRQRLRAQVLMPVALLFAGAGWLLTPASDVGVMDLVLASLCAFALVLTFRVWDDFEDRGIDATRHPERVMAASRRTGPFVILIVSVSITALALLLLLPALMPRLIALAVAAGVVSAWYGFRPPEKWNPVIGSHLVLAKYPLIAYAVAPVLPPSVFRWRPLAVLLGVYLLACAYEYIDDRELRRAFLVLVSRSTPP